MAISFRKFLSDYGTISILDADQFTDKACLQYNGAPCCYKDCGNEPQNMFNHLSSWVKRMENNDVDNKVLLVFYEDMRQDLEHEITKVAKFLSTDKVRYDTPENIATAVKYSSFSYMSKHAQKFGGGKNRDKYNKKYGTRVVSKSKVNQGVVGQGKKMLSKETQAKLMLKWKEVMEPLTGCSSYKEFRQKYSSQKAAKVELQVATLGDRNQQMEPRNGPTFALRDEAEVLSEVALEANSDKKSEREGKSLVAQNIEQKQTAAGQKERKQGDILVTGLVVILLCWICIRLFQLV